MKQSILYLDDEPACLNVFRDTFEKDFHVRTASTSAEAHLLLSESPAEIVISDQLMPEIAGTEFLRAVSEKYPDSCRVLLSGNTVVGTLLREVGDGTVHLFVAKPWTKQSMLGALERADLYFRSRRRQASARD